MASFTKLARLAAQAAASQKSLERPLAPPAGRVQHTFALAVHWGFALSVVISASIVLGLLASDSTAAWLAWLRIALGLVLIAEGLLLATDWRGARRLMLWRIRRRPGERSGAHTPDRSPSRRPAAARHRVARR